MGRIKLLTGPASEITTSHPPNENSKISCMSEFQTLLWCYVSERHGLEMAIVSAPAPSIASFPATAIETSLRAELVDAVKAEAAIRGLPLPPASAQIAKASVQVDSLVVVSILCAIEPIVGFELPDSVVRSGGYTSVENALGHLLPQIEKQWINRKGVTP
jgi:hypothetical protein